MQWDLPVNSHLNNGNRSKSRLKKRRVGSSWSGHAGCEWTWMEFLSSGFIQIHVHVLFKPSWRGDSSCIFLQGRKSQTHYQFKPCEVMRLLYRESKCSRYTEVYPVSSGETDAADSGCFGRISGSWWALLQSTHSTHSIRCFVLREWFTITCKKKKRKLFQYFFCICLLILPEKFMKISWKTMWDQTKKYFRKIFYIWEKKSQDTAEIAFWGADFNNWTKLHHQRKVQTVMKDRIKRKKKRVGKYKW